MGIVRVGIVLDGNCPGGNCPGGNCPKDGNCPGGNCPVGIRRVGTVRWEFAGWELSYNRGIGT